MSEYIGNRIVPRHDGVWDSTKAYEPLIIVYEEGSGDSYISRKDVPAGTGLNQKEYWALCARFSEQVRLAAGGDRWTGGGDAEAHDGYVKYHDPAHGGCGGSDKQQ